MRDIIIVGAGCVGCATARELSKYKLDVLVLEKGHDICSGASKANSGMIHAGYDPIPGTNEAKFNAPGNRMMYQLCDELEVPYEKSGTTIFATDESGLKELKKLEGFGRQNGVEVRIVEGEELRRMQPDLGEEVKAVLWVPEGGVTNPFSVTFAMAENAYQNGVEFHTDAEVTGITRHGDGWRVHVKNRTYHAVSVIASDIAGDSCSQVEDDLQAGRGLGGEIEENGRSGNTSLISITEEDIDCRMLVNCAGLHSDTINNMVTSHKFKIIPRFGAHVVLDRKKAGKLTTTLMETPHDLPGGGHTKGQAMIPTTGGSILLGCDATEVPDPDTTEWKMPSARQIIDYFKAAWKYMPSDEEQFPEDAIIAVFGGCRPHADTNDFVIGEPDDARNFINAGGTESPAFTASPAIGYYVANLCIDRLKPEKNESFNPYRHVKKLFREMRDEEKVQAIAENPDYAKIVCRCETVTEAEIREAIRRPLGARSIAGVKLRTRAGMGRCQGGFCGPRVLQILAEELGIDPLEVTQCGGCSQVLEERASGWKD